MAVYTLFNQSGGGSVTADSSAIAMGIEFSLSQSAALTGVWFWSPSGAVTLPDSCAIYQITGTNTGTQVSGTLNSSPSWSGAAGSGWVKCSYSGNVTLNASTNYRVCIHHAFGSNFYGATSHYWDTGSGSAGVTSGIISAPNSSNADGSNQDAYIAGASIAYPTTSFHAANYWVDVEVSTSHGTGALISSSIV